MAKGTINQERREINALPPLPYREIPALNYSGIKLFDDEGAMNFYKQFVLGEKKKEKAPSAGMLIGQLDDFLMLECDGQLDVFEQRFSEQFCLFDGIKGSGQAFVLADELYIIAERDTVDGELTTSFAQRFMEAFSRVQADGKYKGKTLEWAITDFAASPASEYLESRIENIGKYVVDLFQVEKSKKIGEQLLNDSFTHSIYNSNLDVYNKFPITWKWQTIFNGEIECKSEIDKLLVDDDNKEIYIKDQKCTYDNNDEEFAYSYLKHYYYIQNAFYWNAVNYWKNENNMKDYIIVDGMEFVVADTSNNNRRPLRYKTNSKHILDATNGFTHRGIYYRGIGSLIEEIAWCKANNIWDCSKLAYENDGIIELKSFE